jgi:hypothetical protein
MDEILGKCNLLLLIWQFHLLCVDPADICNYGVNLVLGSGPQPLFLQSLQRFLGQDGTSVDGAVSPSNNPLV